MTRKRLAEIKTEMDAGGSAYDYFTEMWEALNELIKEE